MMESAAFREMAPILKSCGKIRAIVKDGDTKLANIAKDIGWNVSFIQDPQHLKKTLELYLPNTINLRKEG